MKGEGAIRMARMRRGSGHRHRQPRDRMSVQAGTQRHCGEDLPRDPSAQGRRQVTHGVIQQNSLGRNRRTCRKLRNLVEKSKGTRPSAAKRLVAQRDESSCTCAGAAALVPFQRVLPLSSRTGITGCSLDSGGRQRVHHTYACHDRTAREQCQQVTPLGAQGELLCSSMASCSAWLSGRRGNGRARGSCGDGWLGGGCDSGSSGSSGCWSGSSGGSGGGSSGGSGSAGVGGSCGGEGGAR